MSGWLPSIDDDKIALFLESCIDLKPGQVRDGCAGGRPGLLRPRQEEDARHGGRQARRAARDGAGVHLASS